MTHNLNKLSEPKIFISYAWTTVAHQQWVVELATRLMHSGIEVRLDLWDLKEGHDIYAFMESMVTSKDIDKVLIICDSGYKKKADNREGGVGTETQIITPEIYTDVKQEKFIPIVSERDEKGEHFIPQYMASRMYIDLSSEDSYEENLEKLIRNIFEVPLFKKPALGKPPQHLIEEGNAPLFQTAIVLRKMQTAADKHPKRLKHLWNEFSDAFMESLSMLTIEDIKDNTLIHEEVINRIDQSIPLRNDYVAAIELLCMNEVLEADNAVEFFEKLYAFTEFQGSGSYYESQFDQYKFLITELYLLTATIMTRHKMYDELTQFINGEYFVESKFKSEPLDFTRFRFHLQSLEYRNQALKLQRLSLHADLLVQRSPEKLKKDMLETDILLYFISKIHEAGKEEFYPRIWFPTTYIYNRENPIKTISKLKSKAHFENVKILFNVESVDEFKRRIQDFKGDRGYSYGIDSIPSISNYIKSEDICTIP
ncbi:TIR domain-containing protein [Paenibacillus frigoriresistens]|uniref:SEFIR domain-containing protein n=1 Tax=Paenibacillus alginolyticus TaxID=59839 RepID=UPI001567B664|nr:SEFIR domain-containing protein [Paenibacillus frigoriresistens]NRF96128.1 TIR domain-containing protein [Paenibacillus frigoriresistens]